VSVAVASTGALQELADAWLLERRFTVLSSEPVLDELERALSRPFFAKRISSRDRTAYVDLVRRETILVAPRTTLRGIASDPNDDAVLAAALDGSARYLVTGDRALRDLGSFRDVEIVTARELLELVRLQ
jgi:putative PIN family toxin of toxin-antitoxin system